MAANPAEVVPFEAPEVTTDLKPIRVAASDVIAAAQALTRPKTEAEVEEAAAALVAIKTKCVDPAEAVRKELNKPLAEAKKRQDELIRNTLTVGETYLPDLEKELREGIIAARTKQFRREHARQERALSKMLADGLEGDGEPGVVPFVPGDASPKRTIKTADGMVIVGAKLKFLVTDPDALPEHCKHTVPNEKVIAGLLDAGQDVPGVTALYELNTTVRSK